MGFKLKPQDDRFYTYFENLTDAICEAAFILKEFFESHGDSAAMLNRMNEVEDQGDQIYMEIIEEINHSFVTPFDREDILWLAQELNRVLDHIQGTMEKVVIYKAGKPKEKYVPEMVNILVKASAEIKRSIIRLRNIRESHAEIIESCEKIRSYEHDGDDFYRAGIANLFKKSTDAVEVIKWKEIYEHLETTLDNCEAVSNVIKGVAVKYV